MVVVGGGPGGAVAGALLARTGRRVTVLERSTPEQMGAGTGILLQPNGLAVLYGLGLREALMEQGVLHRRVPIFDPAGALITSGEMPDFGDGLDHALALLRGPLQDLLVSTLREAGATMHTGSEVTAVDPGTGTVHAVIDGEERSFAGDIVVGADGIGSRVRGAGRFGARPIEAGHQIIRAVVEGRLLTGAEYWTALGLFGGSPVGEDMTYVYASADAPQLRAALAAGDLDELVRLWSKALPVAGPVLEQVRSMDDLLVNQVGRVTCRRFVDRRAVLVGDAAHAMAPNLGQGANSAFVDAAVLAREVDRSTTVADALDRYETSRRRPVLAVQRNADRLARLSHLRHPVGRRVRDRVVRLAGHPSLLARQIRATQQVDPAGLFADVRALVGS